MTNYLEWVERVLREIARERPSHEYFGVTQLAEALGLRVSGVPDEERKRILISLDRALRDLAEYGLVTGGGELLGYPPEARRFRTEPLSAMWPRLREGFLDADDEAFLAALARRSEEPDENYANVEEIDAHEICADLGWEWDRGERPYQAFGHLKANGFAAGRVYGGPSIFARVTYAGLVRVLDETGEVLREAEDHLRAGHFRAAGAVAGVELERRLKAIAPPPTVSGRRDPSLEDYNKSAYDADVIDQPTWRLISSLAALRKLCVHVLDNEPTQGEVRQLIDGVEQVLRRYPSKR